ncbi:thiamine-binding protein [Halovenus sp. WSH3]|uniref:Thiamine-binding protein n=1 Tax=Halovenus carboxidivorans TaxID=2692199 RepID=A0A6B0T6F6_9EURY|nr:thiamine-binding protein [Halovenus carboxidivorans]MXR50862.1 thiamine-binding protein [Halovenus carboxidivorans]
MTATAFLSVSPKVDGSMAPEIAKAVDALEEFDVEYETTPMGTILEAPEVDDLFAAAAAAHDAVDADRVGTFLKIDDKRTVEEAAERKVQKVEEHLGRDATSEGRNR